MEDVPVAFWAWRNQAPADRDVRAAFEDEGAKTLFIRAGQIEFAEDFLHRIRPLQGRFPSSARLHLVYNGTRKFLKEFENLDADAAARTVVDTYLADAKRAAADGAQIDGLQLDFDVPTRLLPAYADVLLRVRDRLPPDKKLSITGLPTWVSSSNLEELLAAVDFWIPQYYGGMIPTESHRRIPISSAPDIARAVRSTAALGKPFYAGLSAYGYAILYAADGSLGELRGDIAPASAASNENLELVERRAFDKTGADSEIRYLYRARSDTVIDGLIVKAGETLVFNVPTAASLRASARAVREKGGPSMIGICLFRLPTADDETTLSLAEVRAALNDSPTRVSTTITVSGSDKHLKLRAENSGTASTIVGDEAFTVDLDVPPGSIAAVDRLAGFSTYETLCRLNGADSPSPCSLRRANVLRIKAKTWQPSGAAEAAVTLNGPLPAAYKAVVTTRVNDGRIEREALDLDLQDE